MTSCSVVKTGMHWDPSTSVGTTHSCCFERSRNKWDPPDRVGCPSEAENKSNSFGILTVAGSTGVPWDPSASVGMTKRCPMVPLDPSTSVGTNQSLVLRNRLLYSSALSTLKFSRIRMHPFNPWDHQGTVVFP